jgi:hypothetical protein
MCNHTFSLFFFFFFGDTWDFHSGLHAFQADALSLETLATTFSLFKKVLLKNGGARHSGAHL